METDRTEILSLRNFFLSQYIGRGQSGWGDFKTFAVGQC